MQMILDGRRKRILCDWWLTLIETECEKFLADHGYNKNCIPNNYTKSPPEDLNAVRKNLSLLQDLIKLTPNKDSDLDDMIYRVTTEIYTLLDEFILDSEYILNQKLIGQLGNNMDIKNNRESLKKDMEYLLQMKAMDDEIQRKRKSGGEIGSSSLEMTDVVPIGGLILAHLRVAECELRTVIELWRPKRKVGIRIIKPHLIELKSSLNFQDFTGTEESFSPPIENPCPEFSEFVLATCPTVMSQCCVKVMLTRQSRVRLKKYLQEATVTASPKHSIRLGSFRIKADESDTSQLRFQTKSSLSHTHPHQT
jgi:hypothetical protein